MGEGGVGGRWSNWGWVGTRSGQRVSPSSNIDFILIIQSHSYTNRIPTSVTGHAGQSSVLPSLVWPGWLVEWLTISPGVFCSGNKTAPCLRNACRVPRVIPRLDYSWSTADLGQAHTLTAGCAPDTTGAAVWQQWMSLSSPVQDLGSSPTSRIRITSRIYTLLPLPCKATLPPSAMLHWSSETTHRQIMVIPNFPFVLNREIQPWRRRSKDNTRKQLAKQNLKIFCTLFK